MGIASFLVHLLYFCCNSNMFKCSIIKPKNLFNIFVSHTIIYLNKQSLLKSLTNPFEWKFYLENIVWHICYLFLFNFLCICILNKSTLEPFSCTICCKKIKESFKLNLLQILSTVPMYYPKTSELAFLTSCIHRNSLI